MTVSYQHIKAQVKQQLGQIAEGDGRSLADDTDIANDLKLDSLKVLDLLMDIEDELNISIPMNALVDVRTIADLSRKIYALIQANDEA